MQVGSATYRASVILPAMSGVRSEARVEQLLGASVEETDRYEPSVAVLGAADALLGQDSAEGFQVSGNFGFCPHCGKVHELFASDGEDKTIKDGSAVSAVSENAGAVQTEGNVGAVDEKSETADQPEQDALTGEIELSKEEQQEVEELKQRDQEVRTHEHAHVAAGGQHVRGGISYDYQTGPDGKRYAVGGEVSIDTSSEGDPEDTIRKAQTIRKAALAPAEPSAQDRRAAAAAAQMEMEARQEIAEEKLKGEEGEAVGDVEAETGVSKIETEEQAGGLSAQGMHEDQKGALDTDGVDVSDKQEGLPETPASGPPVAKLDYGRYAQPGQLVDMYG